MDKVTHNYERIHHFVGLKMSFCQTILHFVGLKIKYVKSWTKNAFCRTKAFESKKKTYIIPAGGSCSYSSRVLMYYACQRFLPRALMQSI
jgi:hypothetical protein